MRAVTLEALERIERRLVDAPQVFFKEFGDSSINFFCFYWVEYHSEADFLEARNHAVISIKRAFDQHGITIPFPIRTLDFGIKGGQTLSDQLAPGSVKGQLAPKG